MAETDEFDFDPDPPRWLRPALWVSIPLVVLSCGLVVQSIMALPAMRGGAVAEAAPAPQRPEAQAMAGRGAAEIVQLARLRAASAAEQAHVAALIEAAQDLRDPSPEAAGTVPAVTAEEPPPPVTAQLIQRADALPDPPSPPATACAVPGSAPAAPSPPEDVLPELPAAMAAPPAQLAAMSPALLAAMAAQRTTPVETPRRTAMPDDPRRIAATDAPRRTAATDGPRRIAATSPPARPQQAKLAGAPSAQPVAPRCELLLARLQLGERPTDAERSLLRSACAPRR